MKKILLLLFVLLGGILAHSQIVKSEYQGEYYIISADNNGRGAFSVLLDVYEADNYGGPVKRVVTVAGAGEVLRLKRESLARTGSISYNYWLAEGDARGRRDTNFVYRLPYSAHKNSVKAYNAKEKPGGQAIESPFPFFSMVFHTDRGDTIYAARKGIVARVEDYSKTPELGVNGVMIVHEDGTLGIYWGIGKEGFLIKERDIVYPNTPIAIAGSFDGQLYGFFFSTGYPALSGMDDMPWALRFYKPVFATTEGEKRLADSTVNVAKVDYGLITREMKGREKKKYEQSKAIAPAEK